MFQQHLNRIDHEMGKVDLEGIKIVAYEEVKPFLTGDISDVTIMATKCGEILEARYKQELIDNIMPIIHRAIRIQINKDMKRWLSERKDGEFVSAMASDLEHLDLGVAG